MNTEFVILVAAPLCVYLIFVLYSLQDIEPSAAPAIQEIEHAPAIAPISEMPLAPQTDTLEIVSAEAAAQSAPTPEHIAPSRESAPSIAAALAVENALAPETPVAPSVIVESVPSEQAAPASETSAIPETTAAFASKTTGAPPPTTEATAADETIITEPASVAPMQNSDAEETPGEEIPDGPLELPEKGSPKFVFDYRGRLWVEKKNKGFFKQLRRPQLPPDDPNAR